MYNRYIPQQDGSWRKNRMPEQQQPKEPETSIPDIPAPSVCQRQQSAESFLRTLLPKGLDTGDLLIIVLLLLMAGDCEDEKNTALLTLALYLFL